MGESAARNSFVLNYEV